MTSKLMKDDVGGARLLSRRIEIFDTDKPLIPVGSGIKPAG
jgi:hypothetical protein